MKIYIVQFTTYSKNIFSFVIYMQEKWDPLTWSDTCLYGIYTMKGKTKRGQQL